MSTPKYTSYDEVPYASHPYAQTHPDRLATVATLFGLRPTPVERCRVLELGSASGGNIIPLALAMPASTFVGIDLSGVQVAEGLATIKALGLNNIDLKHLDILDVATDLGKFDYIICHGVYSWVPNAVQDRILEICRDHLALRGVAYISYNTYPGWHMRGMIRDMLIYHARQFVDSFNKVKQARNLLDFLAKSVATADAPYNYLLRNELESFRHSSDAYLYHEHLEEINEPIYFYQFAERAAAKKLRYLGEVDLRVMIPGNYPPEVSSVLQMLSPDLIHLEQYMDFLRNRTFRQTLLCHANIIPNYEFTGERTALFHLASPAKPANPQLDPRSSDQEKFHSPDGLTLSTSEPLVKAAMLCLSEAWPQAIAFETVLSRAKQKLGNGSSEATKASPEERNALGHALLNFYASASTSIMEMYVQPPRFTVQVSQRPLASPLARLQAATGGPVTDLRHQMSNLGELERQLLILLDGTNDRNALLEKLPELASREGVVVQKDGQPLQEGPQLRAAFQEIIDQQLTFFARSALLMA